MALNRYPVNYFMLCAVHANYGIIDLSNTTLEKDDHQVVARCSLRFCSFREPSLASKWRGCAAENSIMLQVARNHEGAARHDSF